MDVENLCMDTKGKGEDEVNWEMGLDISTLLIPGIK